MSSDVVALGAWCDLDPPEERSRAASGASPRVETRSGWSPLRPGEAGPSPGGAHFRVHEFAILADGLRVTLRDDLGFSSWGRSYDLGSGATHEVDAWGGLTRESVIANICIVVLPDDDADEEHPYAWLRELCARQGIETSLEQLRRVPYLVELSERLERRLAMPGTSSAS